MRNLKQVDPTFQDPTVNTKKLCKMWGIIIYKAKYLTRMTDQAAVHGTNHSPLAANANSSEPLMSSTLTFPTAASPPNTK